MRMVTVEYAAFNFFLLGIKVNAVVFQINRALAFLLTRLFLIKMSIESIRESRYFNTISSTFRTQWTFTASLVNEANFYNFATQ